MSNLLFLIQAEREMKESVALVEKLRAARARQTLRAKEVGQLNHDKQEQKLSIAFVKEDCKSNSCSKESFEND